MSCEKARLHVVSFGLAFGITWALATFLLGLSAWLLGWGTNMVSVMGEMYIGFEPTLLGSIIGAIWGFVDLFITGIVIAFIYNACLKCCGKTNES